jgi:hypothetical protein
MTFVQLFICRKLIRVQSKHRYDILLPEENLQKDKIHSGVSQKANMNPVGYMRKTGECPNIKPISHGTFRYNAALNDADHEREPYHRKADFGLSGTQVEGS